MIWGVYIIVGQKEGKSKRNFNPPGGLIGQGNVSKIGAFREVIIERKILPEDVKSLDNSKMPGFNISWYYDGIMNQKEIFKNDLNSKQFNRYLI